MLRYTVEGRLKPFPIQFAKLNLNQKVKIGNWELEDQDAVSL